MRKLSFRFLLFIIASLLIIQITPRIAIADITSGDYTYMISATGTATITKYTGAGGNVTIPATIDGYSVASIGDYAFDNCTSLTSVTIPSSVTRIGDRAFRGCTSLTSVTIPSSVTNIGADAFKDCKSMETIDVDSENTTYSSMDGVLYNKAKMTLISYPASKTSTLFTIPDSVTSIGDRAFEFCSSLTSVTIPSSVTSIGYSAFSNCISLTSVIIPSSVTSLGGHAFFYCTSLTSVTIPSSVTSLNGTFSWCTSLTSVTIPSSVTSIGKWTFFACSSLTSVTIPSNVTSLGDEAFMYCSSLTEAKFYGNAPSLGDNVFADCGSNFKVYYLNGKTGYTNPWYGYPTATFVDSTTQNSTISPTLGNFDKKTSAQADIPVTVTLNGNTFVSITDGITSLNDGTDNTVNGDVISIKKDYLSTLPVGTTTLMFNFSAGVAQTFSITVSDTRTPLADLSATPGNGQVNLIFTAPTGASSVSLMQKIGTESYTKNTSVTLDSSSTGASVTGLINGTAYTFMLVVVGGPFEGSSNEVTVTPTDVLNESNPLDNWQWRNPLPQGNLLNGVTYGNNRFVAVGNNGTIVTSADGISWTSRTSGTTHYLCGVTYGNNIFVAVGYGSTILSSADGITWTKRTPGIINTDLKGVTYGNNCFVAVGEFGTIYTSTDGITWTSQDGPMWLTGVTYGKNIFVAVGTGSTIHTSADGITWTSRTPGIINTDLKGVTYGNNCFVAVGEYGIIVTSADGTSWTSQTSSTTESLAEVSYGNNTFLAVGDNGTILTSTDGTSWISRNSGTTKSLAGITYGNNCFVAVGGDGTIITSADSITWTSQTSGTTKSLAGVTYGNNSFVAVGMNGTILTSEDGIIWTSRISGTTEYLTGVTYGNNSFVAVSSHGTVLTSMDGITWTSQSLQTELSGVTYGNNCFVAVGWYAILTSTDGITWTSRTLSSYDAFTGVTYGNNSFVAVGWDGTILTSADGITWNDQTQGINNGGPITGVTYGNNIFVAMKWYGEILTSADGITWSSRTLDNFYNLNGVTYGNNIFVAVGAYGNGIILTSQDGITWTSRTSGTTYELRGVTYGNNSFVAVGDNGTILQADIVAPMLTVTTTSLAPATVGSAYNATMTVSGGTAPYTWSATGLPTGLSIDTSTGVISGIPTVEGTFTVNITVTDSTSETTNTSLSLTVNMTVIYEALTVSNPAPTGFTVTLIPILAGLNSSDFILKDAQNNPVTITGAITIDAGLTYNISAALSGGQTYTVTATKTGYDFGTPVVVALSAAPAYQSSSIDISHKIVTLIFSEDIVNNKASQEELKNAVTFAANGTVFTTLGANDNVAINGNSLVISFNTALTGNTNKIKVAVNTVKDKDGNVFNSEIVTENISAGKTDECFIATAAYGSKFQPDVVLLRQFRDRFLETNSLGEAFVTFYYRHSPPIAHFIANNFSLKIAVRALLTPLVIIAYLLLHPVVMSTVLALVILMTIWMRRRKKGLVKV